jgi:uncharacterized protein YhbP (UPF0306 family)
METNKNLVIAREVIEKIEYINLATVTSEGNPWNSPVYTAYDKDYTFYWASDQANIHSQNISQNSNVFAVIYDSTAPAGEGFGVYLKGTAVMVTNPIEMAKAIALLYGRSKEKLVAIEIFMKRFPRRLYKFVPETVWVNGDGTKDGDFVDIRTEIPLLEK